MFKITIDENSELPNLKNNTNIHFLRLFYVAAFSATFILLKTKFFILATHCTNKSKNTAIYQWFLDCVAKLQKYRMSSICHVTHGTRWDEKVAIWDEKVTIWDEMGRKWDEMGRESDEMGRKKRDGFLPSLALYIWMSILYTHSVWFENIHQRYYKNHQFQIVPFLLHFLSKHPY